MADATPEPAEAIFANLEDELGEKFERMISDDAALRAHVASLPEVFQLGFPKEAVECFVSSYAHAAEEDCQDCKGYVEQQVHLLVTMLAELLYGGFEPPADGVSGD